MIVTNEKIVIGLDAGNFNHKTENHCFSSGIKEVDPSFSLGDCLTYEGEKYTLKGTPLEIMKDKTVDNRFLAMALFGIAKELIHRGIQCMEDDPDPLSIILVIGLPLNQYGDTDYENNLVNYYAGTHKFRYNGKDQCIFVENVVIMPQGFPALYCDTMTQIMIDEKLGDEYLTAHEYISTNISKALIVDIGGGTVDVISVIDGIPTTDQYVSFNLGLYSCYAQIDNSIEKLRGTALGNISITHHLSGKHTYLTDEEKAVINSQIDIYVDELVSKFRSNKISLEDDYILFVGGGAGVVYNAFKRIGIGRHIDKLSDVCANAKGYAEIARRSMSQNK